MPMARKRGTVSGSCSPVGVSVMCGHGKPMCAELGPFFIGIVLAYSVVKVIICVKKDSSVQTASDLVQRNARGAHSA